MKKKMGGGHTCGRRSRRFTHTPPQGVLAPSLRMIFVITDVKLNCGKEQKTSKTHEKCFPQELTANK